MSPVISEADWKRFTKVKKTALERQTQTIVNEIADICANDPKSYEERYHAIWAHLKKRDKEIALAFDGHSRSSALFQLVAIRALGIVTDEELAGFSETMRSDVEKVLSIGRRREE